MFKAELVNDTNESYEIVDWTIDRKRNKIIALDEEGNLLYYNLKKPGISRINKVEESKDVDIVIDITNNYVVKGEEFILNFSLERPKNGIAEYYIFKSKSSEGNETLYFLNDEKTWQEEPHSFSGNDFENRFENIRPSFYVADKIENFEQVNYFVLSCIKRVSYSSTEELINKFNRFVLEDKKGYYSNKTSIVACSLEPEEIINLETADIVGISLQGIENLLYVKKVQEEEEGKVESYKEVKNRAYFSTETSCLYTKERYDETLNITITYDDDTSFFYGVNLCR